MRTPISSPTTIERIVKTYSDHILFPVELDRRGVASVAAVQRRERTVAALASPRSRPRTTRRSIAASPTSIDEPALTIHYKAEGRQSYAVLLFVPGERPFDLFDVERKGRVKLYVRRVFITEEAELLPSYLRFVRGVVDSEDVPLNISREMLQNNPQVAQIRKALTGRVLSELVTLADKEPERFSAGLGDLRLCPERGHLRRLRAPRSAARACALPLDGGSRLAFPQGLCRRDAARSDRDLLSGRRAISSA